MGILISTIIMAKISTPVVDCNILDNLSGNDDLNIAIIKESQTAITNTLEAPTQKTNKLPSRRKNSLITKIENYISEKYDELAFSHFKQQMLSEVR